MTDTPRPSARPKATVNSDMGEGFGLHTFGNDEALAGIVDLANVACGFHAGDPQTIAETVRVAAAQGLRIGAHPGLPDLAGFGRRAMNLTPDEVEDIVLYQVSALAGFLRREGAELSHVKPHGSLYGMLARDPALMERLCRVAAGFGVGVLGLAGTHHESVAVESGVPFTAELYVDLDYDADGSLRIARRPAAADPQRAADRVRQALRTGTVVSVDGTPFDVRFDSVCVHSDAPTAVDVARAVADVIAAEASPASTPSSTPASTPAHPEPDHGKVSTP